MKRRFLESLDSWARSRSDIVAIALVGSHARNAATDNSDVDLVILTRNVSSYLNDRGWIKAFGSPTDTRQEDYGGVISVRVFYEDGLEIEFGFATPEWAEVPIDEGTLAVVRNGMRAFI
jgi:uncharacterized protein